MSFLKRHKFDVILIAALLLISAVVGGIYLAMRQPGGEAVVTIAGKEVMTLPLNKDTKVVLGSGKHTNTLVIQNGTARMTEASCPDQICVHRGAIKYDGETIVCLPNKVVVRIEGGQKAPTDEVAK